MEPGLLYQNDRYLDTNNGHDLELIDVLWRQDEDLGIGKEVYDSSLRLELEKKQELERIRLQEMQKAQRIAKEKEENERKEQASKWLKENFRRDGETGEWVCVQNTSSGNCSFTPVPQPESSNEDFPTLDSALDYILNMDPDVLTSQDTMAEEYQQPSTSGFQQQTEQLLSQPQVQQQPQQQFPQPQLQPQQQFSELHVQQQQQRQVATAQTSAVTLEQQDNQEGNWPGLVNYFNFTNLSDDTAAAAVNVLDSVCNTSRDDAINNNNVPTINSNNSFDNVDCMSLNSSLLPTPDLLLNPDLSAATTMFNNDTRRSNVHMLARELFSSPMPASNGSDMPVTEPITPVVDDIGDMQSSNFLLHNVSMPADNTNMSAELMSLTSASEVAAAAAVESANTSSMALVSGGTVNPPLPSSSDLGSFDIGSMGFFGLADLDVAEPESLDLEEIDSLFRTMQSEGAELLEPILNLGQSMDELQKLGEELNQSTGTASSLEDFHALDGLEGATGGFDDYQDFTDSLQELRNLKDAAHSRGLTQQRHSESSSDSGYVYKDGGNSPSSFSNTSSTNGSYAGSPSAGSQGAAEDSLHYQQRKQQTQGGGHRGGSKSQVQSSRSAGNVAYNISTSGNGTEHDPHGSRTVAQHHVAHNHTYNTPPGQVPREVKKYAPKEPSRKGPQSRDQRRAAELKIPFTLEEIINSPVEAFNDLVGSEKLSEAQLALIRDIRRRGKNKVAAQNCRKRKVSVIVNLSDERTDLEQARERLLAEREAMERETRRMKAKFGQLYASIFQSLRDDQGRPYDPSVYSLQQSSDGNVFLVPRNPQSSSFSSSSAAVPFTVASVPSSARRNPMSPTVSLSPSSHEEGGMAAAMVGLVGGSTGSGSAASSASSSPSAMSSSPPSPTMSSAKSGGGGVSASKKRKTFTE